MSPARKQEAVVKLVDKFATSERRACRVLGQARSTSVDGRGGVATRRSWSRGFWS